MRKRFFRALFPLCCLLLCACTGKGPADGKGKVPQGDTKKEQEEYTKEHHSYEELLASPYFVDKVSNEYTENQIKNFKVWCEMAGTHMLYNFNADVGMIAPMNTLDEADVLDMYNTDLSTYLGELTVNFLNGNYNIDNYEDYVAELEGLGLREVLAVRQAQYDRYYGAAN